MRTKQFSAAFLFLSIIFCIASTSATAQRFTLNNKPNLNGFSVDFDVPSITRPRVVKTASVVKPSAANLAETEAEKSSTLISLEKRVFDLINQKRGEMNLPLMIWNDDVARVARIHSENMASHKFFSHKGLEGKMVNDRADDLGISKWLAIGENIAYNRGFEDPFAFAVESWMKSPSHRQNILDNRWKESGIGIAVTGDGTYYFTEVFLLRK